MHSGHGSFPVRRHSEQLAKSKPQHQGHHTDRCPMHLPHSVEISYRNSSSEGARGESEGRRLYTGFWVLGRSGAVVTLRPHAGAP